MGLQTKGPGDQSVLCIDPLRDMLKLNLIKL